ncbi:SGNH/GDSL hydrolase family protein [Granulicella arctica]|uniref:Lysophospholipase L1-like esterase n=1 Tax=Granulicella arctica TaxID=940613 RepID=A0A7Y9TG20_9BACT|nr:SGNH/GDSL hydrolase family protein [Granulicella arctica]NYF78250.1 lysophospholipase L1-like esterase [Granulicella arctica]
MLAGCGSNIYSAIVTTSSAKYRAYGDSITAGATLADPATQAYPALVAQDENLTLANNAISGDQACDVPTRQIFANADSPSLVAPPKYSLLIGTNDVDRKGTGDYEAIYILCHQAAIAWLALPVEYKVLANSTGVTTTGSGAIDTTNHWNAWTTGALGSSISFTITTSSIGPIYAWPRIDDTNPGTYTYSLDGVVLGTGNTQTTPRIATGNGTTNSLGLLRLPAVAIGKHVVTFTQTSAGSNGMSIVGIGAPRKVETSTLPTVLVGTIPFQLHGPHGDACSLSDAPCLKYIQDIQADVDLFSGDGLDVRLFDTRQYMFGTSSEMNDPLHPNAKGQIELSHAVEAVF